MVKLELEYTVENFIVVDYSTLNDFVKLVTGLPWDLQQQGDMYHNGSYLRVTVDGESELDFEGPGDEYKLKLESWLSSDVPESYGEELDFIRNCPIGPELMLHHLYTQELIPAGNYLILIDW